MHENPFGFTPRAGLFHSSKSEIVDRKSYIVYHISEIEIYDLRYAIYDFGVADLLRQNETALTPRVYETEKLRKHAGFFIKSWDPSIMPQRIKIAYLTDKITYGGTPLQIVELATHLNAEQFQPHVIALSAMEPALCKRLNRRGIAVEVIGCANWARPGAMAAGVRLFRILKKTNPHILHAFLTTSNVIGAILGRLARIPAIISSHRDLGGFDGKWITMANRWTDRNLSDCVTANSRAVRQALVQRTGAKPDSIEVLYNGIDLKKISRAKNGVTIREALGLEPDTLTVAIVANIRRAKGHHIALRAFERIAKVMPHVKLLICGRESEAAYAAELREMISRAGTRENVVFLGSRPDIAGILHTIDVLIAPSISEGFSNAILEAMAAGKVVVASAVGGNCEQVVDGQTGYLAPPADADALSEKLLFLLKSPYKRLQMGKAAKVRVQERFCMERMVLNHQRLYHRIVNGSARNTE